MRKGKKCSFPFAERNCACEEESVAKRGAAGYLIERQMKMKKKRSEKKKSTKSKSNGNVNKTLGKKK